MQTRVPVSDAVTGDQPLLASRVVAAYKEPDELVPVTSAITHRLDSSTPMITEVVQVYNFISIAFSSAELLQELAHVKGNLLL